MFFSVPYSCLYAGRWQLRARGFPVNRTGTRCVRIDLLRNYVQQFDYGQITFFQLEPKAKSAAEIVLSSLSFKI